MSHIPPYKYEVQLFSRNPAIADNPRELDSTSIARFLYFTNTAASVCRLRS